MPKPKSVPAPLFCGQAPKPNLQLLRSLPAQLASSQSAPRREALQSRCPNPTCFYAQIPKPNLQSLRLPEPSPEIKRMVSASVHLLLLLCALYSLPN